MPVGFALMSVGLFLSAALPALPNFNVYFGNLAGAAAALYHSVFISNGIGVARG